MAGDLLVQLLPAGDAVLFEESGQVSRGSYDQPDTGLPFGRGFIIDQQGRIAVPYFGHQPEAAVAAVYALLGGSAPEPGISIPHLTGGVDSWRDVLSVDNLGMGNAGYAVILYDQWGVRVYEGNFTLGPLQFASHELKQLAPAASCGRIVPASPGLNFRLTFEYVSGGGLAEFNLTESASAQLAFNFSNTFPSVVEWKGIAVMNTTASTVPMNLYAVGGGRVLGTAYESIPPNSSIKGVHSRWFPDVPVSAVERIV
ncbi:MAG: hypothetical protein ABIG68_06465, partial [Acidobacteriota bacterium]